ncbi:hypothetical protein C8F04DRAFT_1230233 [Mycena alexandri]|uniref:DUF7779 domain-containing protein n=1 Tax=Mycena alexandri TaxID=1745969 RepID=A0AAD6TD47_9AGAR|nr:hypothetical protein C8F04DRAFT_1230233 [Mycena alexandri]
MSTISPLNSGPSAPQPTGGKKAADKPKSDWLGPAILTAKTITAAAECAPFPYIKGVSGTVLVLLETVQKVKRNREDLKELCTSTTEIVTILHDQIVTHGNTAAVKFKALCEELESYLEAVVLVIQNLQDQSKGFRGRVKEFVKSSSITDDIAGYQQKIQGLCSKLKLVAAINTNLTVVDTNLKVDEIHAVVTGPSFAVAPVAQSINNCPPPSRIFQGRQTILDKMHQFFTTDSGKQLIYVLHGLGGAGKTQIALKFIQESSTSTLNTTETALKKIAVFKGVGDSAQDALEWLQSKKGWLLFFDNADDPKINLNLVLPQCDHGNIIVTSRNPELRTYGEHSPVSGIEESDATTLLLRSAAKESSEENLQVAAKIAKAGAFISKSEDLNGYLVLYAQNRAQLLREKPEQSHDHYACTVYTTWQISFDQLSQPAASLLQLCSLLHYTGISEDIFSYASKYRFPVWLPPKQELQEPLEFLSHFIGSTGEWNSLKFLDITNEIKSYSLISFDAATKMFSIHPLVHAWSRSTLVDEGSSCLCVRSILGMSISAMPDHDMILSSLRLMPHVDFVAPFDANVGADFKAAFWAIYLGAGKLKEAQDLIEQTSEKYRLVFGEEHPASLEVIHRLAVTYKTLGEYKKAEKLEVTVLEKRTKLLGEHHPATLMVMGNLALTHRDLGEYKKAQELQVVVLGKVTELLGEDHLYTLTAMGNLAVTHGDLGEYKKAEKLEVTVLEKRTKLLGEDHPETLRAMGNLAVTHSKLGERKKAQELEVVVLEKRTKLLGEDHPGTLRAMGNLVLTHRSLGEYKKAQELQIVELGKRTKLLGENHPETLQAMRNLAVTHGNLGEHKTAQELMVVVLEKWTKLLGEDHPETLRAMGILAATHSNLGEYKEAQELQGVVLEKQTKLLGEDHPETLRAMGILAATHSNLGEYKEAQELQGVVLEKQTKLLGEDHLETLSAMGNLALTHSNLGEYKEAQELQGVVLEKQTKLLGEDHPETLTAMGNLAMTHHRLGEYKKAHELQFAVLEKRNKLLGEDHPETLWAMGNLAATCYNLGEYKEAQELQVVVVAKCRQFLGDQHPHCAQAMRHLASTCRKLNQLKEADELEQLIQACEKGL